MRFNSEVYNKIYHPAPEAAPQQVTAHVEQPKTKDQEPEAPEEVQTPDTHEEDPAQEAPEEAPEQEQGEGENSGGNS
jgi:hypothetical protein